MGPVPMLLFSKDNAARDVTEQGPGHSAPEFTQQPAVRIGRGGIGQDLEGD